MDSPMGIEAAAVPVRPVRVGVWIPLWESSCCCPGTPGRSGRFVRPVGVGVWIPLGESRLQLSRYARSEWAFRTPGRGGRMDSPMGIEAAAVPARPAGVSVSSARPEWAFRTPGRSGRMDSPMGIEAAAVPVRPVGVGVWIPIGESRLLLSRHARSERAYGFPYGNRGCCRPGTPGRPGPMDSHMGIELAVVPARPARVGVPDVFIF
jgi:hypothetical protein